MRWLIVLVIATPMMLAPAHAAEKVSPCDSPAVAVSGDRPQLILVVGAQGTAQYGDQFQSWSRTWRRVGQAAGMAVTVLGPGDDATGDDATPEDRPAEDRPAEDRPAGESQVPNDHQRLRDALAQCPPSTHEPLWLVLIGHGTFAMNVARFNLRGPDVTAAELNEWLTPIDRPLIVVNAASCSGPFINALSGPGRTIVTATRSGTEQNFARFGGYFADAIGSAASDLDHDDAVSVGEAFATAAAEVQRFYEREDRIATEHALLDDNGDGRGTPAAAMSDSAASVLADPGLVDGKRAGRLTIAIDDSTPPLSGDELNRREELEAQLDDLRGRKSDLPEEQYWSEVESIAVQLASIYEAATARAAKSGARIP